MFSIDIRQLNRCDAFLALWVIYYLQGIIYPEGGVISTSILAINLLMSMYYAVKVIDMPDKPIYFRGLTWLIIMFSIYGFWLILTNGLYIRFSISGGQHPSYNYIKSIYLSLLPIYPFYYFTLNGYLTEERLKKWILLFFLSCTLSYYRERHEELMQFVENGSDRDEITNNMGYLFLSLLPAMLLFRRNPYIMLGGVLYATAFVIMGMKRGAILIGIIVVLYFIYITVKNSTSEKRMYIFLLLIIAVIGIVFLAIHQMQTSEYAMQRIQETREGRSSGRDEIYSFLWDYFIHKADIIHYLFGRGAYGTLEVYKKLAHNDWLEIAVNQGLLGIAIYGFYWRCFYKTWKDSVNPISRHILLMIFFIYLMKTLFSMSYDDMTYFDTSILGFALANINKFEIDDDEQIEDSMLFVI